MPQNHKYDVVTNVTEERPRVNQDFPINSGIYSVAENVKIEGVYSLAGDKIVTYSKLQRKFVNIKSIISIIVLTSFSITSYK